MRRIGLAGLLLVAGAAAALAAFDALVPGAAPMSESGGFDALVPGGVFMSESGTVATFSAGGFAFRGFP